MADYREFLEKLDRKAYHEGEWQWQEGDYTVTRTTQWSAPGCHKGCGVLLLHARMTSWRRSRATR